MKLFNRGVLFLLFFVALSMGQRLIEGAGFSGWQIASDLGKGVIATALFVALLRMMDR